MESGTDWLVVVSPRARYWLAQLKDRVCLIAQVRCRNMDTTPRSGRNGQMSASPLSNPSPPTIRRTSVQSGAVVSFDVGSSSQTCSGNATLADHTLDCPVCAHPVKAGGGQMAAIAPLRADRTVEGMSATSTLHRKAR